MASTESALIRFVREALRRWYARHQRDLPWRRRRDPYAIWVSEIMLQQTRVATVIPYFQRWLRRFPDVHALAAAPQDDVLKAWEGLGYYARARNLHKAARQVVKTRHGRLPETAEELRKLPGIGRYTAGAIASIAFDLDEPVLDGNVTRVLCRVFRIRSDPKTTRTRTRLWALARSLVPAGKAALGNQALMDLGATVCIPRGPRCLLCPLGDLCKARAAGEQERLPRKAAAEPTPHFDVVAALVRRRGRILIAKRPSDGLLGGLWELPGGRIGGEKGVRSRLCEAPSGPFRQTTPDPFFPAALAEQARERLGIELTVGEERIRIRHAFTHFRITLHVFECRAASGRARAVGYAACRWVRPGELDLYAFPTAHRKALSQLGLLGG